MTVCIAALCSWSQNQLMIVGASDRMLSSPDIKFESPQMKIFQFSVDVVALIAGDPTHQMAICYATEKALAARAAKNISVSVADVAKVYAEAFSSHRRDLAETKYLKPLGLDVAEFLTRQQEFTSDFVADLKADLKRHGLEAEAIIAGKDASGHHIYVVTDPGDVACADAIGFASIGSGKHHADSQFMMARHTKDTAFHTALLQTYAAKKRAEISPTVGGYTDLFYIGLKDGFQVLNNEITLAIDAIYNRLERNISESQATAVTEAFQFMVSHLNPQSKPDATEPPTPIMKKTRSAKRPKRKA